MDNPDPTLLPPISKELLEAIERRFPLKIPDVLDAEREIWEEFGKQRFIQFLRSQYEQQNAMNIYVLK